MDEELLLQLNEPEEVLNEEEDTGEGQDPVDSANNELDNEDIWEVISSFFREKGLVHQQLDSYNDFLTRIPRMVKDIVIIPRQDSQFEPGVDTSEEPDQPRISLQDVVIGNPSHEVPWHKQGNLPPLFPNECRLRDMNYDAQAQVKLNMDFFRPGETTCTNRYTSNVDLGRIPIMLKSMRCNLEGKDEDELPRLNECPHDQGGYFVINGTEKVLVAQERQAANHVYSFSRQKGLLCEIKSIVEGSLHKPRTLQIIMQYKNKGPGSGFENLMCRVAQMDEIIPLFVLFRAMDVVSDKEILQTVVPDLKDTAMLELLRGSIEDASSLRIFTRDAALAYIGYRLGRQDTKENLQRQAEELLMRDLLPHMGTDPSANRNKCLFMGYMVHKLLLVALGRRDETDRDFLGHKRIDVAGSLLTFQLQIFLAQVRKEMIKTLQEYSNNRKSELNVFKIVHSKLVTDGLRRCLATGNFGDLKSGNIKTGVAQTLNRLTYSSSLSNLRRIQNPIASSSKATRPRNLHCTQWGYICPVETPEGGSIGLLKNVALMCLMSRGTDHNDVVQTVQARITGFHSIGLEDLADVRVARVFVNGSLIGVDSDPERLLRELRARRRNGELSNEVSIVRDIRDREIRVFSDPGRCLRPLFVVERLHLKLQKNGLVDLLEAPKVSGAKREISWNRVLKKGYVELIDCEEEDSLLIAMTPKEVEKNYYYSHCEMDPSMILGICASIIPYPNHNQSPRNTYQSAMGKQAMGIYASNFNMRMDTTAHVLFYPQKPLVRTKAMTYMRSNDLPAGHNAVVAISCYSGYNQEDSIIMSRSAVERGFFRSAFWRSYKSKEERQKKDAMETFEVPDRRICRLKRADYNKLDMDGLIHPGEPVMGGDILVGKTVPIGKTEQDGGNLLDTRITKRDSSVTSRTTEKGVVDKVMLTLNNNDRFVKVKVRSIKIPNIGDKFCSRHGQKGTNGIQFRQEDLPFNRDGIVPDLIINPHAIPSRMTVAHLIETLAGKVACYKGGRGVRDALLLCRRRGLWQGAAPAAVAAVRQRVPLQRAHGPAAGPPHLFRPDLLPAPQALVGRQDSRAPPRAPAAARAAAHGGSRARGRPPVRRDGARLHAVVRRVAVDAGAAVPRERLLLGACVQHLRHHLRGRHEAAQVPVQGLRQRHAHFAGTDALCL
ncbi:DNA-directed RNA polymerase II subunit RPB2 [Strigomonas culicis]|uniref:DNA-directed RNA polymerase subunit beta n=1 Tax=Strigomonas culicis TaxID=28005 RepID=S9UWM1_9TRYP|nr:DNA-directed RNA polymerase II subunit RPB2 [Strigomonas culicis]|eukprot:EPY18926.1 DNA-directed RNA polymerase II subunit RPB2 [Strigomonas culicis]